MSKFKKWKSAFQYVNYTLSLRSPRLKKSGACVKKLPWFRRDFRWKLELKLVRRATPDGNAKKNQQKTLPATSSDGLFRSRAHFGSILGFRPDPQNRQKSNLCLLREPPGRPVYKLREALGSLEASGERFYVDFGCSGCLPGAMFGAPGASWERFWRKFSMQVCRLRGRRNGGGAI